MVRNNMSFLGNSRSVPTCYECNIFFKTWNEKKDHDQVLHNRYNSTDNQRLAWENPKQEKQDYFICEIHRKKVTNDFKCPITGCDSSNLIRKSYYISLNR